MKIADHIVINYSIDLCFFSHFLQIIFEIWKMQSFPSITLEDTQETSDGLWSRKKNNSGWKNTKDAKSFLQST